MIQRYLKRLARMFPEQIQLDLKRIHYRSQIRKGTFTPDEPEAARLRGWIGEGDWVIDVGANVGHYSRLFSEIVGSSGRVLCFEPVPATFALLTANALVFPHANVTAFNLAATDSPALLGMQMPLLDGAPNPYMASVQAGGGDAVVVGLPIDSLELRQRIRLVKIDAEGHEEQVLRGMLRLVERDRPTLIVEGADPAVAALLDGAGYMSTRLPGSPNTIFEPAPTGSSDGPQLQEN